METTITYWGPVDNGYESELQRRIISLAMLQS